MTHRGQSHTLLVLLIALGYGGPVRAATWQVAGGSSGACTAADRRCATIQGAVTAASSGDTIEVAAGTYVEHVTVDKSIVIRGAGAASTVVDGNGSEGLLFEVNEGTTVTLDRMAGVHGGGADLIGGAIANFGTLTISNSTLSNNTSSLPGFGGGVTNVGTLTISNSTLSNNTAPISSGGGIVNGGTLTMSNCTLSGNSALGVGGGIDNSGTLTISNSTLSGNAAGSPGFLGGGGNLFVRSGTVRLHNTILANTPSGSNCGGNLVPSSEGHNLSSDASCGLASPGDLPNTDPHLGPLQDNGGPTPTLALLPGSPAIDAGDNTGAPATDQRGFPRITDGNGDGTPVIDIGAFEAPTADQCPNDPNKTEPGACGCGVADTDTDGDGTPDCSDQCPNDPHKTEPGTCGCGVAETVCQDHTPPAVVSVTRGRNADGFATLTVVFQDTGSGLQSIDVINAVNCTVDVPTFPPGTTGQVAVAATSTSKTASSRVSLRATDVAGNVR